jgi:hypothetical protein
MPEKMTAWYIFFISIICFALYRDIPNRMYSFIGDEYAFYYTAINIATEGIQPKSVFSQNGVYGYHPVADSLVQAMSMKVFGMNVWGWKMLNIFIIALVSWLLFAIVLQLTRDYASALATAVLFAGNRYLFAFAHIGYNNLHALVPPVVAVWFYLKQIKTKNVWHGIPAGIFAGLCLYTFFSARLALLCILPVIIGKGKYRIIFITSFLMSITPFVFINGTKIITASTGQGLINHHITIQTTMTSIIQSARDLTLSGYMRVHHFVYGPPISFLVLIFSTIGFMCLAIKRKFKLLLFLLATSLGFAIIIVITFYSPDLPITRLHVILPALAFSAGYLFQYLPKKSIVTPLILFLFLSVEAYQFYVVMPRVQPIQKEAVAMQVIHKNHGKTICMDDSDRRNFWYLFDAYQEIIHSYYLMPNCDVLIPSFGRLSLNRFDGTYEGFTKKIEQDKTHQTSFTYYVRK